MRLFFHVLTNIGEQSIYNIDLLVVFLSCFLIYRYAKPKKYLPVYITAFMILDTLILYFAGIAKILPEIEIFSLPVFFPWIMSGILFASYKGLKNFVDNGKKIFALIILCIVTVVIHDIFFMYYDRPFLGSYNSFIFLNSIGLEFDAVKVFFMISVLALLPVKDITPAKRMNPMPDILVYGIIAVLLIFYVSAIRGNLYKMSVFSSAGLTIISVISLNIVTGLCGRISVAHSAISAIGAYTATLLASKAGLPVYITIPLGCFAGTLAGAFIGCFSFLRNFWLGIFTLFFSLIVTHIIFNVSFFGGPSGISGIKVSGLNGAESIKLIFFLVLAGIIISFLIFETIRKSELGKKMVAIKEGEQTSNKETYKYKIAAFAISGFIAGMSGALLSYKTSFINPYSFTLSESAVVLYLFMIAGPGTRIGPFLSVIAVSYLAETFRSYGIFHAVIYLSLILIFLYRFLFRDFLVKKVPDLPVI